MNSKISILSETAINQIAAGEVVEGPASVVKELVENAIDAKADKVSVEIKGGGHFLIEVTDNGIGMDKEDVLLSIERFATSKISSLEDLSRLESMGFRGEALAAISSVSKFSIISSTGGVATKLLCSGGKNIHVEEVSRKKGTTISVESLFYNTPARKKFQKARGPSTTEIIKTITRLSLCHRTVDFILIVDGKQVLDISGGEQSRIDSVLGKDFFSPSLPIKYESCGIRLEGVIASPEKTRVNRLGQYLVVNKRNVYALLISNAVSAGFGTSIGRGEFPLFFLDITFDPDKIDVNVHPQKKEVRFQEEEHVFAIVREAISSSLTGSFDIPYQSKQSQVSLSSNVFKEFNYVEKEDMITPTQSYQPQTYISSWVEDQGDIAFEFIWDELCIVKVSPPHPKFKYLEAQSYVVIDLSLLGMNPNRDIDLIDQKLMEEEEVFLTTEELAIARKYLSFFNDLGIDFSFNTVSISIHTMPEIPNMATKEVFMYTLDLFGKMENIDDIKEKILFKGLRKKQYTISEALLLIKNSQKDDIGTMITKKGLKELCREFHY